MDTAEHVSQNWAPGADASSTILKRRRERLVDPDPCSKVQEFVTALHAGEKTTSSN